MEFRQESIYSLYLVTCVSFLVEKAVTATGYPEFYDCNNACTHRWAVGGLVTSVDMYYISTPSSVPCPGPGNSTPVCSPGYWLCGDQAQCILHGEYYLVLLSSRVLLITGQVTRCGGSRTPSSRSCVTG